MISTRILRNAAESVAKDSLKIKNPVIRDAVLKGEWKEGPPSLKSRKSRLAYIKPEGLDQVFPLAMEVIKKDCKKHYAQAQLELQKMKDENTSTRQKRISKHKLEEHLVKAQLHNPEVLYNHTTKNADYNEPIYRHLAKRDWEQYEMLVLLQRLEQLHVIPDTMPTIKPRAKVDLQFPGVVNKWISPGDVIRNSVSARTPRIKVQEFEKVPDDYLYTILIVDPDTPDLDNDSFSTTLHWAVSNVPLNNVNHEVDLTKSEELVPYLPPHPEKNSGTHRYCVWVYRQTRQRLNNIKPTDVPREQFDIRAFADKFRLDPVGAHVWRGIYDRSTNEVREKFNLGVGNVYRRVRNGTVREDKRA